MSTIHRKENIGMSFFFSILREKIRIYLYIHKFSVCINKATGIKFKGKIKNFII